jgi:dihydrofolate reductase
MRCSMEYKNVDEELVVCGGATIYKLALPYVDKMVISEVKKEYVGDAYFPSFEEDFILESIEEKEEFIIKIYRRK